MKNRTDPVTQTDRLKRLGAAIRTLRGKRTQTDFGRRLGVPQTTVSRWEHGHVDLGVEQVRLIEDALDAPNGSLLVAAGLLEASAVPDRREIHTSYFSTLEEACEQLKAVDELGLGVVLSNQWRPEADGTATLEWVVRVLTEPGNGAEDA